MQLSDNKHPLLLFDGICNFCNQWVNFIIRNDKEKKIRFAPLQSDAGKSIIKKFNISSDGDTVVLIDNEKIFTKSSAALRIMKHIGGAYYLLLLFMIVPKYIRDVFYDGIARNRYKWWGKRNECMIPTEDVKDRFVYSLPFNK